MAKLQYTLVILSAVLACTTAFELLKLPFGISIPIPQFLLQAPGFGLRPFANRPAVELIPGTNLGLIEFRPNRTTRAIGTYFLGTGPGSFAEVDVYCRSTGRELVSIKNDVVQRDVEQLLAEFNVPGNLWLRGACVNSVWTWADGTPVSRLFNKLPFNSVSCPYNGYNLMMFGPRTTIPYTYTWNGESGGEYNYFICKA